MGASKSRPLVKESARTVLARKNAMPEAVNAAKSATQAALNSVEQAALSADKPSPAPPATQNTSSVSATSSKSKALEQPLRSDVLSEVSKWQLKTQSKVRTHIIIY